MKPSQGYHIWVIFLVVALLAGGLAPATHARLNDPQQLVPFFNLTLPGWQVKEGFPKLLRFADHREAQVILTSGGSTIYGIIEEPVSPELAQLVANVMREKESDDETYFRHKSTLQGFKTIEIYAKKKKGGLLYILVADNCVILLEGEEIGDTKILKDLASKINLMKLAALVK